MRLIAASLLLLQAFARAEPKWTLHKSCYEDEGLRKAMEKAVETAKSRSENAIKNLDEKADLIKNVKKSTEPLLGTGDTWRSNADKAIERFKKVLTVKGPIGAPKYADSEEWEKLKENKDHHLDFVIYCAPDIRPDPQDLNNYWWDNARQRTISEHNVFVKMKAEKDRGSFDDEKKIAGGVTETEDTPDDGERWKIPETITIHPLWLEKTAERNYNMLSDERIKIAAKSGALTQFRMKGMTPIDSLVGLDLTMHHEFFHLSALGKMKDDNAGAYMWENNTRLKNLDNPDFLAYVALVIELVGKKYKVKDSGEISTKWF